METQPAIYMPNSFIISGARLEYTTAGSYITSPKLVGVSEKVKWEIKIID
jgi:hypothetical protein